MRDDEEQLFTKALNIFETEIQTGTQLFYFQQTFNYIVNKNQITLDVVNCTPLFWNTTINAIQTSLFILLDRIFSKNGNYNIEKLLKLASLNIHIFSKSALMERKIRLSNNEHNWVEYIKDAYVPSIQDFQDMTQKSNEYRDLYNQNYKSIRDKIYAHKVISTSKEVLKLFNQTNTEELKNIIDFINNLHNCLFQLLMNGVKPNINSRASYSIKKIMRDNEKNNQSFQVKTILEVEELLKILTLGKVANNE